MQKQKFENYFGRKIAVDASMHIYQFMAVVGRAGDTLLMNESGEVTSHLQGMFFRTTRMLEAGIKPVYVFDGKPPQIKQDLLAVRLQRRTEAGAALEAAKESGDAEAIEKFSKRTIRVTREHNEECRKLLRLMGVPVVEAPSEAEAQCAAMAAAGLVYGVATEDMDALTFGTPRLVRHLMAPASQNAEILEFDRAAVIEALALTTEQFVDLCILCGCDYSPSIRGIGAVRALQLIQKHGSIEKLLENLDASKYGVPDPFPFAAAREFFLKPEVSAADSIAPLLKWSAPDEEGLVQFLSGEKGFNEERVRKAVSRIVAAKGKASQGRVDSFFTVLPKPAAAVAKSGSNGAVGGKRKQTATAAAAGTGAKKAMTKKGRLDTSKKK